MGRQPIVLGLFVVAVVACTAQSATTTTEAATTSTAATPSTTTSTTTLAVPDHPRWIDIAGEDFVDTRNGEIFAPVGVNLLLKMGGGGGDLMFANYDPEWVESQLSAIADLEFNTVRFFLDMCMHCTSDTGGVKSDYLDDLADLLTRLEAHGLVALPTSNDVPDPGYSERLPCCEPFGGYRNSLYLSEQGHAIAAEYWTDLLAGIEERGAPTHHVLAWQLANEQFVLRDVPPISLSTGTATTADGVTYNLADDAEVEEMVISNLRTFITTVGDAIRSADEGALVTMGFFSAAEPDAGRVATDNRWVVPDQILRGSDLDFVDLHAYPGLGGTWESIASAYGLDGETVQPLLLGEFGAFHDAYPQPDEAAAAMAGFQAESCEWGLDGWLLWFWGADRDDEVITGDAHDATVARAISPTVRPDPCDVGPYRSANLALGRPVTASAEENEEYGAVRVTDGSDATWWSAAAGPPQWVEIELDGPQVVSSVEILIGDVSPPGPQVHRVYLRVEGEAAPGRLAGEVSADVAQGEWLVVDLEDTASVVAVRVETVLVDGWVIIHEVKILAE